jgi:hypothetical protein
MTGDIQKILWVDWIVFIKSVIMKIYIHLYLKDQINYDIFTIININKCIR